MVIIGLLAGYVAPKYFSQIGKSEVKVARAQIDAIEKALDQYRLDVGPLSHQRAGAGGAGRPAAERAQVGGPYLKKDVPPDPWGKPYQYKSPGEHGEYDLVSFGKDGQPGGAGRGRRHHQLVKRRCAIRSGVCGGDNAVTVLEIEARDEQDAAAQAAARGLAALSVRPRSGARRAWPGVRGASRCCCSARSCVPCWKPDCPWWRRCETLAEKEQSADAGRVLRRCRRAAVRGAGVLRRAAAVSRSVPAALRRDGARERENRRPRRRRSAASSPTRAQLDIVRKKISSALIYPVLLIGVGGLVTLFLMGYVVPRFSGIYAGHGAATCRGCRSCCCAGGCSCSTMAWRCSPRRWRCSAARRCHRAAARGRAAVASAGAVAHAGVGERMRVYQLAPLLPHARHAAARRHPDLRPRSAWLRTCCPAPARQPRRARGA